MISHKRRVISSLSHWDAHLPLFFLFDITNDQDLVRTMYFLIAKQRLVQLVMISKPWEHVYNLDTKNPGQLTKKRDMIAKPGS